MKATRKQISVLTESIDKVVKMLVSHDIAVTQEGSRAYVEYDNKTRKPSRVNIPIITEDAPVALLDAVQGFIDGEVAHALFSDGRYADRAKSDNIEGLYDIADDIMAESRMRFMYRGSRSNLNGTYDHYLDNIVTPKIEQLKKEGADPVRLFMEGYAVPAVRAWGGQERFQEFMKERWEDIAEIADKIPQELKEQLSYARNSEEAYNAATRLAEILIQDPPPSSGDGGDSDDDNSDEQSEDNAQGGSSGQSKDDNNEEQSDGGSEAGDNRQQAGMSAEQNGDDKGGQDSSEAQGDNSEGEGRQDTQAEGDSDSPLDNTHTERSEWPSFNDMENMGDSMMQYIADLASSANKLRTYKPYTTRLDIMEPFSLTVGENYFDRVKARLNEMTSGKIANLSKNLERVIAARSKRQNVGGFRSGRLHTANLYRLSMGDDRVFRRRQETTTKEIAVQVIVDCSGSMRGMRYQTAIASSYAISRALDKLNINNEVCGFTTHTGNLNDYFQGVHEIDRMMRKVRRSDEGRFNRFEPLYLPIFKSFGERSQSIPVVDRFTHALGCQDYLANNVDGESIQILSRRLMAQPEKGKLIIVLSDGAPAASYASGIAAHLKKVVNELIESGVSVFGIGIQTDSVQEFYDHCEVIKNIDELPGVIGNTLRNLILRQLGI